jgi:hypothetical protein
MTPKPLLRKELRSPDGDPDLQVHNQQSRVRGSEFLCLHYLLCLKCVIIKISLLHRRLNKHLPKRPPVPQHLPVSQVRTASARADSDGMHQQERRLRRAILGYNR